MKSMVVTIRSDELGIQDKVGASFSCNKKFLEIFFKKYL
jgi:hypothetical protein